MEGNVEHAPAELEGLVRVRRAAKKTNNKKCFKNCKNEYKPRKKPESNKNKKLFKHLKSRARSGWGHNGKARRFGNGKQKQRRRPMPRKNIGK